MKQGYCMWKIFTLFIRGKMFGLAARENLGQRRPYNGVNSLFRINKDILIWKYIIFSCRFYVKGIKAACRMQRPRAAVVHLNFRAGSTFLVPVCTVPSSMERTSQSNMVDTVRFNALYRLNLLLLKGQRCVRPKENTKKRLLGTLYNLYKSKLSILCIPL